MEIWKLIPSTNGYYEASNLGNIRRVVQGCGVNRLRTNLTPQQNKSNGRMYVPITIKRVQHSRMVHKLVAEAFLGSAPSPRHQVDHIDEDFTNNVLTNLQWLTPSENTRKSYASGLRKSSGPKISEAQRQRHAERPESCPRGEKHPGAKHTMEQIESIRQMRRDHPLMPITEISKILGFTYNTCQRVLSGTHWKIRS